MMTIKILSDFRKNLTQKLVMPEKLRLAKFFLVTPVANTFPKRSILAMEFIRTFLRTTATGKRLYHCVSYIYIAK